MPTKKKILVVVESIDVNDSSGSKVNVALIKNLAALNYIVTVLHYTRKNIQLGDSIRTISIKERKASCTYVLSRTQRVISRLLKINMSVFLENIFGHSFTFFNDSKSISKAIKKYSSNEDLILTLSKGASFRPHHAMLRFPNLYNKWMAYVHDPYPFHYYPRPYNWVEKGHRYKESFFRKVSEKAKYSAFPSLLLKEWMGSYFPNFLKTGMVIPHQGVEVKGEKSLPSYFSLDKFTLLHAGNLMSKRDPRGLIAGYKMFLQNNPQAKDDSILLLLGPASYHQNFLENELNDNVFWSKGSVPFDEVYTIQKNASVNIILEAKSEISPFLPAKFTHCVKANKPILLLGPFYSETKRLLKDDYPYIAEIDDARLIAILIEKLYLQWGKSSNDLKLNRADLDDYLSIEHLGKTLAPIFANE
ncbi:UDP-glycosyltransferase [Pseudofulvibacter geojedonensis]|uniref:UDP-glycosyltransferase n=1 Tax=Pseudofulvibacter geojedonensis TaxID=1123758 RepID=A0ABW3HYH0_9FLAO